MQSPVAVYAQNNSTDRLEPLRAQGNERWAGRSCEVRLVDGTVELSSRSELSRVAVRWAVCSFASTGARICPRSPGEHLKRCQARASRHWSTSHTPWHTTPSRSTANFRCPAC